VINPLTKLFRSQGLDAQQVADLSGISRAHLYVMTNKNRFPSHVLAGLCTLFGTSNVLQALQKRAQQPGREDSSMDDFITGLGRRSKATPKPIRCKSTAVDVPYIEKAADLVALLESAPLEHVIQVRDALRGVLDRRRRRAA